MAVHSENHDTLSDNPLACVDRMVETSQAYFSFELRLTMHRRAEFMSRKIRKNVVVWCCITVISVVAALGQSLHVFVGTEHGCCAISAAPRLTHACHDKSCFSDRHLASSSDGANQETAPTCERTSDGCAVCQLLTHLSNGFFSCDAECHSIAAGACAFRGEPAVRVQPCLLRAARGPPVWNT